MERHIRCASGLHAHHACPRKRTDERDRELEYSDDNGGQLESIQHAINDGANPEERAIENPAGDGSECAARRLGGMAWDGMDGMAWMGNTKHT